MHDDRRRFRAPPGQRDHRQVPVDTEAPGEPLRPFTLGTLGPDSGAHTLDRVSPAAFYLDLRHATPAARDWLGTPRPTRGIGTAHGPASASAVAPASPPLRLFASPPLRPVASHP
ncbi:erythromycin esterase family protein [Streptomyces massasporeus]